MRCRGTSPKKADIDRLFIETKKAFGQLDILVNNAGIYEFSTLEQITEEHFHKQFDLNVLGLLLTTQEALKYFSPAGGNIINISSLVSTLAPAKTVRFIARTKGAVDYDHRLARERTWCAQNPRQRRSARLWWKPKARSRAVSTQGDFHDQYVKNAPLGRIGQPQDIAKAVTFLASGDSSWVSGETLLVSGGHR